MRTWIIGSGADCDIVVAQPRVSGRHCRFTELADGHLVEDLGSSNGTYRQRRADRGADARLGRRSDHDGGDRADALATGLGRARRDGHPDRSRGGQRHRPRRSRASPSHHARLIVSDSRTLIEDTGSANGTFVNSPDNKATQAIPLGETDTVYFGSLAVPAARLLPVRTVPEEAAPVPPPIPEPRVPPQPVMARPSIGPRAITPWTILLLAQAPVIAILILLFSGRRAAAANWPAVVDSIASTTFALALAAVWLGGSLAMWASPAGRSLSGRVDSLEARILHRSGPEARVPRSPLCRPVCGAARRSSTGEAV